MHYIISSPNPSTRFIDITFSINNITGEKLELHLPAWRPGRYELGNFAKNIQKWAAFDDKENRLPFHKTSKDSWIVETKQVSKVIIKYNYYASQPDAGGCWTDHTLLYINPVHLCLYVKDKMHLPCKIQLDISSEWKVATGLIDKGNNLFEAVDFNQLADCPIMASGSLLHHSYEVNKIKFNIWISGECKPDWKRIEKDFTAFTKQQLDMMKSFPVAEYHFLILALPYKFYHGVEHSNSTVLALGPGYNLMQNDLYEDLLGVASHELFHVWNIKAIRPSIMLPYNYNAENYSSLGWVYEGFTTYYGDLFLARSGNFNQTQYLKEVNFRLQKHMDNYGKFNLSVAESSFDTWLDGYSTGIPSRKTSIYDEGSLIALMLDLFIRKNSSWKYSLDDLMISLYNDFALQNRGYREQDIKVLVENLSGKAADDLFNKYINGHNSYDVLLQELLQEVGCYISRKPALNYHERLFGFRVINSGSVTRVNMVAPSSPAEESGLAKDDEIISVNNLKVEYNLSELFGYFSEKEITLDVFTQNEKRTLKLSTGKDEFYSLYSITPVNDASVIQKANFINWCSLVHS